MQLNFSISNQLAKLCKPAPVCHRNLDMSINGHLGDAKLWLEVYKHDVKPRLFDHQHAWRFCEMLNQQTKRVNKQRRKGAEFAVKLR